MYETDKFKDAAGDSVKCYGEIDGRISMYVFGVPYLTTEQARQLGQQLINLANEIEG